MSITEFALPSFRSTTSREIPLSPSSLNNNKKFEFHEIKQLIHLIQDERQRNDVSCDQTKKANVENNNIRNVELNGYGNGSGDDDDDFKSVSPRQDLEMVFELLSLTSGFRNDEDGNYHNCHDHKGALLSRKRKRARPWTTQSIDRPTTMMAKTPAMRTKRKLLSLSPYEANGIEMFRVNPEILSQIKNCEALQLHLRFDNQCQDTDTTKNNNNDKLMHIFPQETLLRATNDGGEKKQKHQVKEVQKPKLTRTARQKALADKKKDAKPLHHQHQHKHQNEARNVHVVRDMLQTQRESRAISFQIRNERIHNARQRRNDLRNDQLYKLEENLRRKEQQRLDHLSLKKKEDRQLMMITTIILVSKTYRWLKSTPQIIEEYRYTKLLNDAARKIQTRWKKEMFSRRAMEARSIRKKLRKFSWRLQIWSRCARRRLNARIIRQLFLDFSSNPFPYLIHRFRCKVVKAQKMIRSFIECKRARLVVLELSWAELEREVISEGVSNKLRRRKNALSEITHRKIIMGGGDQQNLHKSSFINVVTEVLQRPNSAGQRAPIDPTICRNLCRFHLEDSRRSHVKKAGVKEVQSQPVINRNHAILLLSGEELTLNIFPLLRRWPIFSLFSTYKERLKATIRGE